MTTTIHPPSPRFSLGASIVATPAALDLFSRHHVSAARFLERHANCDWGDVCPQDWAANDQALKNGSRLLSAYRIGDEKLWIITEAVSDGNSGMVERASTCLLTPGDY